MGVAIFALVTGAMRSSWAYTHAVELAESNPEVLEALGEPLETGWLATGSIEVSGPSGEAELAIPIKGPRGSGTLYVIASKRAGQWAFELVQLEVEGRPERIDLLAVLRTRLDHEKADTFRSLTSTRGGHR
jgi:hypothetical protein